MLSERDNRIMHPEVIIIGKLNSGLIIKKQLAVSNL